ncbi:MAG: isoprenylcysteine carboxylmethyltransferase family protein [Terracidiphilus sp.]
MVAIYHLLILASWLTFIASWALLASRAKRSVGGRWSWPRKIALRLVILILILLPLHFLAAHHAVRTMRVYVVNTNLISGFAGAALCACGVTLAVWARVCLGRDWGMPMEEKAHFELVTHGPYATIRHPIYAGIILAILGSAIGQSVLWAIPLLIIGPYLIYSAGREEKMMTERFPNQYPSYLKRTRMIIPFIG